MVVIRRDNIIARRFGRWTVICPSPKLATNRGAKWLCKCDCGNQRDIRADQLKNGKSKSCGCLVSELAIKRQTTHGMSNHSFFNQWRAMISRCENKNNVRFHRYGGRGIKVCKRWKVFENFYDDMWSSWKLGLSIERIDNDRDYKPSNCRWATKAEQNRNKGTSKYIDTEYGQMNISDAADMAGIHRETLRGRIRRGWSSERLLDQPK